MRENLKCILEFKSDILARLYQEYPQGCLFTEQEYGCYLFDSRDLYLRPDSDDTLNAIEQSRMLTQSFSELKSNGVAHTKRVSHMGWSAELTPFGYHYLQQLCAEAVLSDSENNDQSLAVLSDAKKMNELLLEILPIGLV